MRRRSAPSSTAPQEPDQPTRSRGASPLRSASCLSRPRVGHGRGVVTVKGVAHEVAPGYAVLIPADAPHAVHNPAEEYLQVAYLLVAHGFADVRYVLEADR